MLSSPSFPSPPTCERCSASSEGRAGQSSGGWCRRLKRTLQLTQQRIEQGGWQAVRGMGAEAPTPQGYAEEGVRGDRTLATALHPGCLRRTPVRARVASAPAKTGPSVLDDVGADLGEGSPVDGAQPRPRQAKALTSPEAPPKDRPSPSPIAQLVERVTVNHHVPGSSPGRGASEAIDFVETELDRSRRRPPTVCASSPCQRAQSPLASRTASVGGAHLRRRVPRNR